MDKPWDDEGYVCIVNYAGYYNIHSNNKKGAWFPKAPFCYS